MSGMYVMGGMLTGVGMMGAASVNPYWGWVLLLGVMVIGLAFAVEQVNK